MSTDVAIQVDSLSKVYKLYDSPQDRLKEALNPLRKRYHNTFCALDDVSFKINCGETVGIIGRNGSGKSTLLKLITGVLTPTSGSVSVRGKVSALLELSAGFNPEMTGLENIYFNGTINGFTRDEIDARVASIRAFADIGDFVHQPVKLYSSGMSARLGFAVAIHTDPDILIIDEALSVGDLGFQNKCYRKIDSFVKGGKTVLFVSHALPAVRLFCHKAAWLNRGKLQRFDVTEVVTDAYEKFINATIESPPPVVMGGRRDFSISLYKDKGDRVPDTHAWIDDMRVVNTRGDETAEFITGERMRLQIEVTNAYDSPLPISLGVAFTSSKEGMEICRINNIRDDKTIELPCGSSTIELNIPALPLLTGEYLLSIYLAKENIAELFHKVENLLKIDVNTPFATCGWRRYDGIIAINHNWSATSL